MSDISGGPPYLAEPPDMEGTSNFLMRFLDDSRDFLESQLLPATLPPKSKARELDARRAAIDREDAWVSWFQG